MGNRLVSISEKPQGPEALPLTMLLVESVDHIRSSEEDDDGFTYDTTGTVADVSWDSG